MDEREQTDVEYFSAITKAPRVEVLLDHYQRCYPGIGKSSQARYFEEVHQALAPLARELERENGELRAEIDRLNATIRDQFAARRTTPDREALVEEIADTIDHMGEGRFLEEYVEAIRTFKSAPSRALDRLAENARDLGLDYMTSPTSDKGGA